MTTAAPKTSASPRLSTCLSRFPTSPCNSSHDPGNARCLPLREARDYCRCRSFHPSRRRIKATRRQDKSSVQGESLQLVESVLCQPCLESHSQSSTRVLGLSRRINGNNLLLRSAVYGHFDLSIKSANSICSSFVSPIRPRHQWIKSGVRRRVGDRRDWMSSTRK